MKRIATGSIVEFRARLDALRNAAPDEAPYTEPQPTLTEQLERAGVPSHYRSARLADVTLPGFEAWLASARGTALLWGDTGRGKTHAACAAIVALRERGKPARFISARELLRRLQREIAERTSGTADIYCEWPTLIVLDDIGREWLGEKSGWARERIADVIAARLDNALPLLVTTNLSPADLARLDAPIASRLCGGLVLRVDGQDRRIHR